MGTLRYDVTLFLVFFFIINTPQLLFPYVVTPFGVAGRGKASREIACIGHSVHIVCAVSSITLKYLFFVITKITVMFQIVIYANLEIYAKNNITTRLLHY